MYNLAEKQDQEEVLFFENPFLIPSYSFVAEGVPPLPFGITTTGIRGGTAVLAAETLALMWWEARLSVCHCGHGLPCHFSHAIPCHCSLGLPLDCSL